MATPGKKPFRPPRAAFSRSRVSGSGDIGQNCHNEAMDRFLEGKTALVTGASRGIGRAVAQALLQSGAAVCVCGRTQKTLDAALVELASAGTVTGRAADVSNPDDVAELFRHVDQHLGWLDILVNNAGIGIFASVAETTIEQWRRTLGTNLDGAFYCSREALSRFRTRGGGFILNISSLAGKNPFAGGASYNASKFGLNGFSEAMMLDHRYDNVRVSYILPGSVATEFGGHASAQDWKIAPEDIAEIVLAVLRMPARTLISRVEVRPSQPRKG
jgi:3-oxoacyl-[acyl-carrier protein] reductase